ncbi:uncharacterized protein LOC101476152 isoform X2 [Maylandia zebra]|uniref:uncharacterized protein LOC101476152 isoform X2 n=1 Tax=Maylandia zebra TaxID=106582 RepID=UPI00403C1ED5
MLTLEHRKTHGFNSAGRFLTTYKKDYGPVRERYPHLNSRDEPPPSSAFMSSFGILTPSVSVANQGVGSALAVHWMQELPGGQSSSLVKRMKVSSAVFVMDVVEKVWLCCLPPMVRPAVMIF